MIARSKRYKNSFTEAATESDLSEAIEKLSAFEKVKFDETVEISMSLGVDPKQTSQAVRGVVNLPHGSGKEIKVLVFTENPEDTEFKNGLAKLIKGLDIDGDCKKLDPQKKLF